MTLLTPDPGLLGNTIINNRYQLQDHPREGTFAYVYEAFDNQVERRVAVKVLKPLRTQNSEWLDHFRNEAAQLAELENPYVVQVYEIDTDTASGLDYLAMEWVGGQSLAEWRRGAVNPSIENLLDIALDICEGLQAIHSRGMMHGDITPRNIYLAWDGGRWHAKLIDLGLTWQLKHTAPAELDGTLSYAAPEQLRTPISESINIHSDIYGLGALLFFLFSGQHYLQSFTPAPTDSLATQKAYSYYDREHIRQVILSEPARSLQSILGACNTDLNNLLLAMLEKDLSARQPQTIAEVQQQLEAIQKGYARQAQVGSGKVLLERPMTAEVIELELELFISDKTAEDIRSQLLSLLVNRGHLPESALNTSDQAIVSLLFKGGEVYDTYLYNDGGGVYESEHRLRIALATDSNNPNNLYYTETLHSALVLECLKTPRYPNSLLVRRIDEAPADIGVQSNINLPARLKFSSRGAGSSTAQNMPDSVIDLLKTKPKEIEADSQVMQRLGYWRSYINAWKRLVSEHEFEVEFVDYRLRNAPNGGVLAWFYLNEETNIPWERLRASINELLYLRHYEASIADEELGRDVLNSADIALGPIERLDEHVAAIQVRLDPAFLTQADSANPFPRPGYLAYKMLPDLAPIRQQAEALEALGRGRTPNAHLPHFIFDAAQAGTTNEKTEWVSLRRDMLLLHQLDADQRRTIESALNAPDLFLIEGLPGTGKTTLIGELCYQFTQRNQRVLLVTQTGEMVERLLASLPHHPSIRPLRVGKGRPNQGFTREAVVSTWFKRMSLDANERLGNRGHRQEMASYIFNDQSRLQLYLNTLEQEGEKREQLQTDCEQAYKMLDPVQAALEVVQNREHELYAVTEHLLAASQALRNDHASEFEPNPNPRWRSEIFNVVNSPEYQTYLSRLIEAVDLVEQAQPGATKTLLEEVLNTQDYLMIQRWRQGVPEARHWSHRVTSLLSVGPLLAQSLEQSANLLGILQSDIDSLLKLAALYDDIQNQYLVGTELALASAAVKNLTDPMPRIDKVVTSYQTYMRAFQTVQESQERYKQAVERESALAAEVESKQAILVWQVQINDLQQQPIRAIELINETAAELEQYAESKTTGSLSNPDNAAFIALQQTISDERDLINQCQAIQTSMDEAMISVGEWLLSGQTMNLRDYLPDPLVKGLEQHRWANEDPIYRAMGEAHSVCRGAIAELDRIIPSKYFLLNTKPDKLLSDRLRDLFDDKRQTDKYNCVYPANTNKFAQQLQRILSERLKNARTSRKADAQAWMPVVSEYYVIVGFEKLLSRQLTAHSARLAEPIVQQGRHRLVMHELLPRVIKEQQLELQRLSEQLDRMKAMLSAKAKRVEQQREQVAQKMDAHLSALRNAIDEVETQLGTNIYSDLHTLLDQINWKLTPEPVGAAGLMEEALQAAHEAIHNIFAGHQEVLETARVELADAQAIKAQCREDIQQAQKGMGQLKREIAVETETLKGLQASWQQWENIHQPTGIAAEIQSLHNLVSRGKSVQKISDIRDNIAQLYDRTRQTLQENIQANETRLAQKKVSQSVNAEQLKAEMSQADVKRQSIAHNIMREMERLGGQRLVIALNGQRPPVEIAPDALLVWQRLLDLINKLMGELKALPRHLDPLTVLDTLIDQLHMLTVENAEKVKQLAGERDLLWQRRVQAEHQLEQYAYDVEMERLLWEEIHDAIPRPLLETLGPVQDIHYAGYVRKVMERANSDEWQQEWSRQTLLMAGLERLVESWMTRLGERRPSDIADLQALYLANVNVMGATYSEIHQIGRYHQEYRPFDVVIIDDANRATPSELLLPMLRARKIILLGDNHQLPPMVGEQTLLEAVQGFNLSASETEHLRQSYFANLVNSAPQDLKATLTHQYRMKDSIRQVVNHFYDTPLRGGQQREHGMILSAFSPDTDLVWIDTPAMPPYLEEKVGGSYRNLGEVEIIEQLLRQINDAWMKQLEGGAPKQVGVITFYDAQARRLQHKLQSSFRALDLHIGTVDEFQSLECQVVLVSLVRNHPFAADREALSRFATALSRGGELLVIIGPGEHLAEDATDPAHRHLRYHHLIETMQQEGTVLNVSSFA